MMLFDTHCHLTYAPLWEQIDQVLSRASAEGVRGIMVPGVDSSSWDRIDQIRQLAGVHCAFGLHPLECQDELDVDELERRLKASSAVAIGEIGLDKSAPAPLSRQLRILKQQLQLAADLDLPVLLHCRGAFEEMLRVLQRFRPRLRGVFHGFARSFELATRFVDCGLHVGFGGALTRENAWRAHESARGVPAQRLLLETDAPCIAVREAAAEQVEPRHVVQVAERMAQLRGMSCRDIAEVTTNNALELFRIP